MLNTTNSDIEQMCFNQIKAITLKTQFKEKLSNKDLKAIENSNRIKELIFKQIK